MKRAGHHVLYVCDNASSHKVQDHMYSNIKFLLLPPNATLIVQPLDQGIILSAKRRYKAKLKERYTACAANGKDAYTLLKKLDTVTATNIVAAAWRETSSTIIQNCFHKAGFKHHGLDPEPQPEEPPVAPPPEVWRRVQNWLGDVEFDDYVASEPQVTVTQPMMDEDIVDVVCTENDTVEESED